MPKINKDKIIIFFLFIIAILLRVYVSKMGNNIDYGSWKIVGSIVDNGKNVYEETTRYNYGPIWALMLGFFKKISLLFFNDLLICRLLIIFSLSLADIFIAVWLYKYIGILSLFWFLFNPISIYISGFHNQFDNISIAIALYSLELIEKYRSRLSGYLLLGLSLIVKHIFLFFPIWLFISAKNAKQRLLSLIPLLLFFISFLPFLTSKNVFLNIFHLVFTTQRDVLYTFLPKSPFLTPIIILFILIPFGFLIKKEKVTRQGLYYLLLFVAALTNSGGQYLAIPLVAYAVLDPLAGLLYISLATLNIIFHSLSLETSLILSFQMTWLVLLKKYAPILKKPLKIVFLITLIITVIYSLQNFIPISKDVLMKERKKIWFMQSLYPADKVFFISKEKSRKPLISGNEVKGQFIAEQNNLGFIAFPFKIENPSSDFLKKEYKVTTKIREVDNSSLNYQETRALSIGLTGEGILLGFPIIPDSRGKKYELFISTDIPKEDDYLTIDLTNNLQARYFLSRNLINNPNDLVLFLYNKFRFFFLQESTISVLLQLYSYIWIVIMTIVLYKNHI